MIICTSDKHGDDETHWLDHVKGCDKAPLLLGLCLLLDGDISIKGKSCAIQARATDWKYGTLYTYISNGLGLSGMESDKQYNGRDWNDGGTIDV